MTQQQRTVLIIDDFSVDRETYRRYLLEDANYSYTILEEESAESALALCCHLASCPGSRLPDVILLDFLLPDLNGLEFLTELKAQTGEICPPVIVVTGHGNESIAAKAIKTGAEDYLVKRQITPDGLQLAMRTAIKNAELRRKLAQSETRFRTSVENMLDCFGIYSAIRDRCGQIVDFRTEYVNAAACESNQMTQEQQLGKLLCELLPAHRDSGLFEEYCQVVETGKPLTKESLIYSDMYGEQYLTRAFDIRVTKLEDGFVAAWRDITAKKQAEIAQQQHIERERIVNHIAQQIRRSLDLEEVLQTTVTEVRQFLQTDRVIIFRLQPNRSGTVVTESVGDGWTAILSTNLHEPCFVESYVDRYQQGLVTAKVDIYDADLAPCHIQLLEQFQVRANLVVPILQGEELWGLLIAHHCAAPRSWQPLEIELLQQLSIQISIAIQQSELYQQVQIELVERQQIVKMSAIGIGVGKSTGKILEVNDTTLQMLGYTREEFDAQGLNWKMMSPPEYAELDQRAMEELRQTGRIGPAEKELIHKDGRRVPVLISAVRAKDTVDEHAAFIVDLTERKQWEQDREALLIREQVAREEAEIANRTKDEFLAIVSHELRSPLNAILGWTKLLRDRTFDPATVSRALATIERNAQTQNQLIDDLLDVSRIIQGKLRLNLEPVDLVALIATTITNQQPSAETKQIQLTAQMDTEVAQVSGDPDRLQQIVTNLLTNAIKFTPPGGRVEVVLSTVHRPTSRYVAIRVRDTGKGIAPEFLPYVFERFRQAQTGTSQIKDGLGLGLADTLRVSRRQRATTCRATRWHRTGRKPWRRTRCNFYSHTSLTELDQN